MRFCVVLVNAVILSVMSAGAAYALCVNVPEASVRMGPGTTYELAWEVYKYMPFEKVGTSNSGSWYAVKDVDGDVNWIHKSLVIRQKCAVVTEDKVNIRKGPGTRYSKTQRGPAGKYESFKVLLQKGRWVKVKDAWENTGWIYRTYLWIR